MGILDDLAKTATDAIKDNIGDVVSGVVKNQLSSDDVNKYASVITDLIGNNGSFGGLGNLVQHFEKVDLGGIVQSWIGKSDNQPISNSQIQNVLGSDWIKSIAEKVGINHTILTVLVSQFLPKIIDYVTPNGSLPKSDVTKEFDVTSVLLSLLKK